MWRVWSKSESLYTFEEPIRTKHEHWMRIWTVWLVWEWKAGDVSWCNDCFYEPNVWTVWSSTKKWNLKQFPQWLHREEPVSRQRVPKIQKVKHTHWLNTMNGFQVKLVRAKWVRYGLENAVASINTVTSPLSPLSLLLSPPLSPLSLFLSPPLSPPLSPRISLHVLIFSQKGFT